MPKPVLVLAIFLACAIGAACAHAQDAPTAAAVAIVTDLAGAARATHEGRTSKLSILDTLQAGDHLALENGANIEIVFPGDSGVVVRVSGPARVVIRLDGAACESPACRLERRELFGTWRSVVVPAQEVDRASVSLRGSAANRIELREPVGDLRAADLASLRWSAPRLPEGDRWHFTVRIIDERGTELWSGETDDTSLDLPDAVLASRAAAPPSRLLWTVAGVSRSGRREEGAAEFRLTPGDK